MDNVMTAGSKIRFEGLKWLWLVPWIVALDQISKWLVFHQFSLGEQLPVFPGLTLTLAFNSGVAFSWFANHPGWGQWLLIAMVAAICAWIGFWLITTPMRQKWLGTSLAFILGGALGNLADRIHHGFVIDFIDFYIRD